MTNKELLEYNKNRRIAQICLCTDRRLEDVLDQWIDKLKVGPWGIVEMSNETLKYCGWGNDEIKEPFKYLCACAMFGNIQIEIIQKVYGPFMGEKFLQKCGEGLQHFKEVFSEEEFEHAVEKYEEAGFEKTFYGGIGDNKFCNFDSDPFVGFTFEVGNDLEANLPDNMIRIYPPEEE